VIIDRLEKQYDYVIIDNEAGMEHLSRRTTRNVDYLLLVTDPTQRGLIAAQRMCEMVPELEIGVGHIYLVVNRLRGQRILRGEDAGSTDAGPTDAGSTDTGEQGQRMQGGRVNGYGGAGRMPPLLAEAITRMGLELLGTVPEDSAMAEFEFAGRPLVELPAETTVYQAVREIARRMLAG
jgi:CO dehydrogenase maturation factor